VKNTIQYRMCYRLSHFIPYIYSVTFVFVFVNFVYRCVCVRGKEVRRMYELYCVWQMSNIYSVSAVYV